MGLNFINVYYVAVHRSNNADEDIRFFVHKGLPVERKCSMESKNVAIGVEAWKYARNHPGVPRDNNWNQKMEECWTGFNNVDNDFKDELYRYMSYMPAPP